MEEKILGLILEKLENIQQEQGEMKQDIQEIKQEQREMKQEQQVMKQEQKSIIARLDKLEKGQESIKEFIINLDDTLTIVKKDHEFIERLKKAVGE